MDWNKLGIQLQAFGEGVGGRGQQFIEGLNAQRKEAMARDALQVQNALMANNPEAAMGYLTDRVKHINRLAGDPSHTLGMIDKIQAGDLEGALADAKMFTTAARTSGYLPQLETKIVDGQVVTYDPATNAISAEAIPGFSQTPEEKIVNGQVVKKDADGNWVASDIEGFNAPGDEKIVGGQVVKRDANGNWVATDIQGFDTSKTDQKAREIDLRRRQLELAERTEDRQANKLSAGLEKQLMASQDNVVNLRRQANKFETLADDYLRADSEVGGGIQSTVSEAFKWLLGSQDDVSELRREFNGIRMSEGVKYLPPGTATDKDVAMAMKGVPPDNAPANQVASFLRGAAKLARFNAGYNQYKADYISNRSSPKGLNKGWRRSVEAPSFGRSVTVAEIYATAQNRGITPEDVMTQLGIEGGLYD